ncbi:hypothetical protein OS128_01205 [Corynebacterium sp. P5848]|uniref:hypothetical protein n=1 Tax=Corynebacterium marambiense TaxID=2765364 RepID=UPI002260DF77|nr:hypothetical protein [Corynebacterium marambiense]MCX7541538.1 hypothetical protein [Corynebacterium marambiense]
MLLFMSEIESSGNGGWTLNHEGRFERFLVKLPEYEQAVLVAALVNVLGVLGKDTCRSEWCKPLKGGLYEFRVKRSLRSILSEAGKSLPEGLRGSVDRQVLLRVFCTFHGDRIVLLLGGYDKKRDPSSKRQNREIRAARKELKKWREKESRKES